MHGKGYDFTTSKRMKFRLGVKQAYCATRASA
jgi:hypothetical protein